MVLNTLTQYPSHPSHAFQVPRLTVERDVPQQRQLFTHRRFNLYFILQFVFSQNDLNVAPVVCTVLYCTVLYCTVLYCTVLYCTKVNLVELEMATLCGIKLYTPSCPCGLSGTRYAMLACPPTQRHTSGHVLCHGRRVHSEGPVQTQTPYR